MTLTFHWTGKQPQNDWLLILENYYNALHKNGLKWLEFEVATVLSRYSKSAEKYMDISRELRRELGIESMVELVRHEASWKHTLRALQHLAAGAGKKPEVLEGEADERLIWLFSYERR
ncbi:MAG: hypothetical protein AAF570_10090 [Bacteroidota bacterium]